MQLEENMLTKGTVCKNVLIFIRLNFAASYTTRANIALLSMFLTNWIDLVQCILIYTKYYSFWINYSWTVLMK